MPRIVVLFDVVVRGVAALASIMLSLVRRSHVSMEVPPVFGTCTNWIASKLGAARPSESVARMMRWCSPSLKDAVTLSATIMSQAGSGACNAWRGVCVVRVRSGKFPLTAKTALASYGNLSLRHTDQIGSDFYTKKSARLCSRLDGGRRRRAPTHSRHCLRGHAPASVSICRNSCKVAAIAESSMRPPHPWRTTIPTALIHPGRASPAAFSPLTRRGRSRRRRRPLRCGARRAKVSTF